MDANGVTRADVMARTGRSPQAWSNLAKDAKWGALCEIMTALGFDLEQAVYNMLNGRPQTETFAKCPYCGKVWEIIIKTE